MDKKVSLLMVVCWIALVLGCSHAIIPPASPQQEAFAKSLIPKKGKGLIYLFRPIHFMRADVNLSVFINEEPFGVVGVGEYIYANVDPGTYVISIQGNGYGVPIKQLKVEAAKLYFLEINKINSGSVLEIIQIDEAEGRELIEDYRLSGELFYENRIK